MCERIIMIHKGRIRPSRIGSAIAVVFGTVMLIVAASEIPKAGGVDGPAKLFLTAWFVALIGIVLFHVVNALGGRVPAATSFEIEKEEPPRKRSTTERLVELEGLRNSR